MIDWHGIDAVLFDMDGVLTKTQTLHRSAWASTLAPAIDRLGGEPAYVDDDYYQHLDGRRRLDGVRAVLSSRNLSVPEGGPDDDAAVASIHGISRAKDECFRELMRVCGVDVYPGAIRFLDALQITGRKVGLVTSSNNALEVLRECGLDGRFDTVVDGLLGTRLGLAGKPAPDTYVHAAAELGVPVERCAVIEDAIGGVAAAASGGFGLVIGVDVGAGRSALLDAGAHIAVEDLATLVPGTRAEDPLDGERYPLHPWRLSVLGRPENHGHEASLLAVGNGYLGLRGASEFGDRVISRGSYVNGFYESWQIEHAEDAVGFARVGQTIVETPDATQVSVTVDDEELDPFTSDISTRERRLDLAQGVLHSSLLWTTRSGQRVRVESQRFVSWADRHVASLSVQITPLDGPIDLVVTSVLANHNDGREPEAPVVTGAVGDPRRARASSYRVLLPVAHHHDGGRGVLAFRTAASGMRIAVGADHAFYAGGGAVEPAATAGPDRYEASWRTTTNGTVSLTKLISVHTCTAEAPVDVVDRVARTLDRVVRAGASSVRSSHVEAVADFWRRSDAAVSHDLRLQQAIRWSLFQVGCATIRADGLGIAAKGVSGSGYDGHYFWDAEIYIAPMLTYTIPDAARSILEFRYSILDAARLRAREVSQAGALFPWRTINGNEASAYYAAGTAQYHIDADIAYGVDQYVAASGDREFMVSRGIDILVETARMWADLGFWRRGACETFHIYGVTGPDEYTTVVNDNLYTNAMARFNLRRAAEVLDDLAVNLPGEHARIVQRLAITPAEVAEWRSAADKMYIGFDARIGVHPQDDRFLAREVWDVPNTPASKRPLLLHYHPLVIYRYQVIKQADVVLALMLLPDDFTDDEKRHDFEYYDALTTGDSTLSGVAQAVVAAEVGYSDLAITYFTDLAFIDLTNSHGNTDAGVHVAATGGVWSTLVFGFAGMNDRGPCLSFDPRLPRTWPSLTFCVTWRGTLIRVELRSEAMTFTVVEGDAVEVRVRGDKVWIPAGSPLVVPLAGQGPVCVGTPVSAALTGMTRPDGTLLIPSLPLGDLSPVDRARSDPQRASGGSPAVEAAFEMVHTGPVDTDAGHEAGADAAASKVQSR